MRSAPQTVGDQALRLRIALCGFELDQTIEQFIDELGFLRGHSVSPCLRTRWSCRWRIVALGGAARGHRNLKPQPPPTVRFPAVVLWKFRGRASVELIVQPHAHDVEVGTNPL